MRVKKVLIWCITAALIVGVVAALSGCGGLHDQHRGDHREEAEDRAAAP